MKLTQEQQDMLDGKYGKGTAYAMKIQVAIGECFDAKRMVAHHQGPCGSLQSGGGLMVLREAAQRRRTLPCGSDR